MFDSQSCLFQDFPLHCLLSSLPGHSETTRKRQPSPVAAINHQDQLAFPNDSDSTAEPAEERKPGISGKSATG